MPTPSPLSSQTPPSTRPHTLQVQCIPAFDDNYFWLIHNGRDAAVVDPGAAAPIVAALKAQQHRLCAILINHHHPDHCGGVSDLLQQQSGLGPAYQAGTSQTAARDTDRAIAHRTGESQQPILALRARGDYFTPDRNRALARWQEPGANFCRTTRMEKQLPLKTTSITSTTPTQPKTLKAPGWMID